MTGSPSQPEVSVVVVTHNSPEWTQRCLDALLGPSTPRRRTEVVVVDSASDAPTRQLLQRYSSRAVVRFSHTNLGYGRGCNVGVDHSSGRYLVMVNPDAVVAPGCIDALVDTLEEHPSAGIVGGRTLWPDGALNPLSCFGRPTLWSWFCFAVGLSTLGKGSRLFDPESLGWWPRDTERVVGVVSGCLLAIRRDTWQRLGGYDEDYFMYGEDADLSLRAATLGWYPRITPRAVAVHAVGASSGRRASKARLLMTGKATLARKRWTPGRARIGVGLLLLGVSLRALGETVLSRRERSWTPLVRDRSWTSGWPAQAARPGAPVAARPSQETGEP